MKTNYRRKVKFRIPIGPPTQPHKSKNVYNKRKERSKDLKLNAIVTSKLGKSTGTASLVEEEFDFIIGEDD